MRILVAPDSFGGTLTASEAAAAIAAGWRAHRPDDQIELLPMSDGGEGLLEVLGQEGTRHRTEVAGPLGHPQDTSWVIDRDGTAIIAADEVCGLRLLSEPERDPLRTTTFGVGQLLAEARSAGARRILVGLGGTATVDGGAGALAGLNFRLQVADGSGLKVGGEDLHRVARADRGWSPQPFDAEIVLLADVTAKLLDAARIFGPQKGASEDDVELLTRGLSAWADVAERDLAGGRSLRNQPGTGAAGGLGFGLACALGAHFEPGAAFVAERIGLPRAIEDTDLVITGEGRLDPTSISGKVVGTIRDLCHERGRKLAAVVGQARAGVPGLDALVEAAPQGPGEQPHVEVQQAATQLARRLG